MKSLLSILIVALSLFSCISDSINATETVDFKGAALGEIISTLRGVWKVQTSSRTWGNPGGQEFAGDIVEFDDTVLKWTHAGVTSSTAIVWSKDTPPALGRWTISNWVITPDRIDKGVLTLNEEEAMVDGTSYTLIRYKTPSN